ncbi:thiamine pyrophosphate-binding protein [Mycobacterium sp. NAZ190054]|uniref:thiamine pyrophosphate-binding protein n=1 Tax=Mycobacterium sp. NAZ190054 TaxID=1747766 RepID=UPI000799BE6A|nr:thiamine pyrophosphate-binding protein [Mycobacterium sp. NAZ190054]KWX68981.1 thiamine pyrophosphate-binding protein [Mycobacterium sp. NAZ190054]
MRSATTPGTVSRTGAQVLVDQLALNGTDTIFAVAGESYLAVTDALYEHPQIQLYSCRQEGGAAFMAEATGKLTGRPGVCLVTRGPGATNASIGVHTAFQDSTPMILLVGQVARPAMGREGFQELDYVQVFSGLAKWAVQIDDAARIPEIMHRAFTTAISGRPGPVVIALPEDMLEDQVTVADGKAAVAHRAHASNEQIARLAELLAAAQRPLLIAGGSCWDQDTAHNLVRFAETWQVPAMTTFRRQDLVDNNSPAFAGALGAGLGKHLTARVREADLIIALGGRLGEMTTAGYTLLGVPDPGVPLVHVHPDADELGRVYTPELGINADPRNLVPRLLELPPVPQPRWTQWYEDSRRDYLRLSEPSGESVGLNLAEAVRVVSDSVPADTVITNGAGNYTAWLHRFHRHAQHPTQLGPTNGAMGYGLPAAIAAAVQDRQRLAIAYAGDGCMLMNGQELATVARYDLPVIVIVVNNGHLGTIRMHQEMRYPGRVINTGLTNPDFVAYAESFGLWAERVTETDQFTAAFGRARSCGRPALLELVTDPEQSTPDARLSGMRAAAQDRSTR